MFNKDSCLTITESVVKSANSGIELANFTTDSATNPLKIGLRIWAFREVYVPDSLVPCATGWGENCIW